jgi:hypothetical protein
LSVDSFELVTVHFRKSAAMTTHPPPIKPCAAESGLKALESGIDSPGQTGGKSFFRASCVRKALTMYSRQLLLEYSEKVINGP